MPVKGQGDKDGQDRRRWQDDFTVSGKGNNGKFPKNLPSQEVYGMKDGFGRYGKGKGREADYSDNYMASNTRHNAGGRFEGFQNTGIAGRLEKLDSRHEPNADFLFWDNPSLAVSKKGKGNKKRPVDPMTRKEWFDVKAPSSFTVRQVGKTLCNKTIGKRIAKDNIMGRVFEASLADLNNDEDQAFRKIRLRCEDVQGKNVLTQFHGMDMTRDKLGFLTKRWQSLIEAFVDVTTTDGYLLRLFSIAFTKKRQNQHRTTSYAQSSQKRAIRAKMVDIMRREAETADLKELVAKFVPESIGREIISQCQNIYPLQNVYVRKCKVLKTPRFDLTKLMEQHTDLAIVDEAGQRVERSGDFVEPEVLAEV